MQDLRHYFGFKKDPFPQNVAVKDLYPLPGLEPLEKRVLFALHQKAVSVITGDVGSGKSTALRYISSKCHPSEYQLITIVGGAYSTIELYRQMLMEFGTRYYSYQVTIMTQIIREAILEIASRNVIPVLMIDEAHLLKREVFTHLHTLAQFEYDSRPVMPIILCGQDILLDHLMANASRPLASRILGRSHLEALKKEVMSEYLAHHVRLAGSNKTLFSDEAIFAIHQNSGGLLRKANFLAKAALLAASMDETQTVAPEHVRIASTEII
jgi:type II secretory pathway predicted ATPase ExeA